MRDKLDEWRVIETLLPDGWLEKARDLGAFIRPREFESPRELLRVLLSHAAHEGGTRSTAARAKAGGIVEVSGEAVRKRLASAGSWLGWIATELSNERRDMPATGEFRLKAIDSTTIEGPTAKGTEHRLHYVIDLNSLQCDWHQLTDVHGGEHLERAPVARGDVLIGDRNFLQPVGVSSVVERGGHVLVRLRANHPRLEDEQGNEFVAVSKATQLRVSDVGEWTVDLVSKGVRIRGRVVALRLPAPLVARNERRIRKKARRKQRKPGTTALLAAQVFMVFTTLPATMPAQLVLDLYRFRWQIEIAFKRLKQILGIGHLPHRVPDTARAWILAKLVLALLLEKLRRNASAFSPWGYEVQRLADRAE
jgi:hypothetical protein